MYSELNKQIPQKIIFSILLNTVVAQQKISKNLIIGKISKKQNGL
jgi:hypothetical protein